MAHHHDPFSPEAAVKPVSGKAAAPTDAAPQPEAPAQTPQGEQAQAPAQNENGVPQGTVGEVLDWVGDDKGRAQAALDAENASGDARKTLVSRLQDKLDEPVESEQ